MNKLLKDSRLYIIFSITLIAVMGVASLAPAFPKISQSLNLNETEIGLLISIFTLPGIFLSPVAGILADRFSRKTVLIPSLFLFAFTGFACFFIHNYNTILIFRFFQGMGAAGIGSLNITLVGDFFKGKDRPAAMGYNASVLSLATTLFPLIGGFLAGIVWYYPFLLPLLAIPIGLLVIFGMEEPKNGENINFFIYLNSAWKSIIKKEVLGLFSLSIFTFIILYGAYITYIPFLLNQKFGMSPAEIGIFISISSFSTAITATQIGKLSNKFGSVNLLKTAFLLYFSVSILFPNINNQHLFLLPIVFFGVAQALNIPSLQTLLTNLAPDDQRAIFMSTNGMVLRIGQTLGPPIIGIGFAFGNISGVYYLSALVALFGFIIIISTLGNIKKAL